MIHTLVDHSFVLPKVPKTEIRSLSPELLFFFFFSFFKNDKKIKIPFLFNKLKPGKRGLTKVALSKLRFYFFFFFFFFLRKSILHLYYRGCS
jgi:hypothetical protein